MKPAELGRGPRHSPLVLIISVKCLTVPHSRDEIPQVLSHRISGDFSCFQGSPCLVFLETTAKSCCAKNNKGARMNL